MSGDWKPKRVQRPRRQGNEPTKACPRCDNGWLLARTNTHSGGQFLGCTNYPTCRHSEDVPENYRMRAMGHPELPLFEEE